MTGDRRAVKMGAPPPGSRRMWYARAMRARRTGAAPWIGLLLALWARAAGAHGLAVLGSGRTDDATAELAAIFGRDAAFSATAHVTERAPGAHDPRIKDLRYLLAGDRLRLEIDLARDGSVTPAELARRRTQRTDQMIWILRPDRRTRYQVYPRRAAYCEYPEPRARRTASPPTIATERAGTETVDGTPCNTHRIAIVEDGETIPMTTWTATDGTGPPLRLQVVHEGTTVTVELRDVTPGSPAPALFEPPAGFTRYGTCRELEDVARRAHE